MMSYQCGCNVRGLAASDKALAFLNQTQRDDAAAKARLKWGVVGRWAVKKATVAKSSAAMTYDETDCRKRGCSAEWSKLMDCSSGLP